MLIAGMATKRKSRCLMPECVAPVLALLWLIVAGDGSVTLTQTHPAAPYVCRTGNITLRCQYDGVENVQGVVWIIGNGLTSNPSTIPGHTALPRTTTYQEVVVDSYTSLRERYQCDLALTNGSKLPGTNYTYMNESSEVTLSSLTLASRTATTLRVTWSAGYPKCYSFTVSHSTQDGSITITQPADGDTSHTLTSLQPGTTYRIEVEAVRKGDGADGQRAKVVGYFTTEGSSITLEPNASSESNVAGAIVGGVIGGVVLILVLVVLVVAILGFLVHRRKTMPGAKASTLKAPSASQESATQGGNDPKQTYAVLDWQNPQQRPVKAPDNEWFTVQYSEVHFAGTK